MPCYFDFSVKFAEKFVNKRSNLITCLIRCYRAIFLLFFTSSMIIDPHFRKIQRDACPCMNVKLRADQILHRISLWSWRESVRSHPSFYTDKNLRSFFFLRCAFSRSENVELFMSVIVFDICEYNSETHVTHLCLVASRCWLACYPSGPSSMSSLKLPVSS